MGVNPDDGGARGEARSPSTAGSEKIGQRSPPLRNTCPDGRHRDLGETTGDEGGEDHAERPPLEVAGRAAEHETNPAPRALYSGRDAGIGRPEAEAVPALESLRLLAEPAGQGEQVPAVGGDAPPEGSAGVRGERRRDDEPPSCEVGARVRGSGCRFASHASVGVRKGPSRFLAVNSSNHEDGTPTHWRERA